MLTESLNSKLDLYLLCTYSFSDKWIKRIKADVKSFMVAREKDNLYYNFLDWQKKENEILVLTMYAFANIPIPQRFNIVFQVDNPDNFVETEYVITQAIINGWTSINQILRGHKHITVVEFANSIPDLCNLLSDFEDHTNDNKKIHLGFCDKEHFQTVKAKMKQSAV